MKEILSRLNEWRASGEEVALATLIRVSGSAPRQPGARLLITRGGRMEGSVSGGCVENDVFERALLVLDSGEPATAEYGIADELGFSVGLSCGGNIEVLIEPVTDGDTWSVLRRAIETDTPAVVATAISPPELAGCRLIMTADGATTGEIAAEAESMLLATCRELIENEGSEIRTIPIAGAEVSLFFETFAPRPRLYIVGATHTAIPLSEMADMLGFRVSVLDARGLFTTEDRFPQSAEVLRKWPHEALAERTLDRYSYVAILTHDPKFDLPTLELALRSPARYIGAMGSRATHAQRKDRLREMGFSDDDVSRIHAPIGLNLGGRSPEEIAVSIIAEIVAARYDKRAAHHPSADAS